MERTRARTALDVGARGKRLIHQGDRIMQSAGTFVPSRCARPLISDRPMSFAARSSAVGFNQTSELPESRSELSRITRTNEFSDLILHAIGMVPSTFSIRLTWRSPTTASGPRSGTRHVGELK